MAAVEYAIEHDDGLSSRPEQGGCHPLIPSRCGKTPTTMYLAPQHGVFVRQLPLVPEDLEFGQGIDSMSLNPDSVGDTWLRLASS
jgi:regulator of PEP synthase PpsR (kinase-PPPase family)